ncbi:unnamed protein product, partial [Nesidiocoris tenuis]
MTRTKTVQKKKIDVCPNCKENITNGDKAVLCDGKCRSWFHINCVGISEKRYQALLDDDTWLCRNCGPTPPAPLDSSEFSKFVIDDQNPAFKRIGDTLNQITCSLSELQRSVQYQSSQYDEFYRDMKSMQLENARLNKDMTSVKEDVKRLDMDGDWLKKRVNHLEQTMIANELEINGIPGNFTGNVFDILNKICDLIKIKIEEQDVIDIRRINSDRRQRGNSPTIVVFRDRSIRQKILDSRKSIPTLTLKDVGVDLPGKLFLNERLTPFNRQLFWLARQTKSFGFKYCWVKNGIIYIRRDESSPTIKISDEKDIPVTHNGKKDSRSTNSLDQEKSPDSRPKTRFSQDFASTTGRYGPTLKPDGIQP